MNEPYSNLDVGLLRVYRFSTYESHLHADIGLSHSLTTCKIDDIAQPGESWCSVILEQLKSSDSEENSQRDKRRIGLIMRCYIELLPAFPPRFDVLGVSPIRIVIALELDVFQSELD